MKKKNVEVIRTSFEKISWKPNEEPKMASKAELLVTLFYTKEKDMPERIYDYQIWSIDKGTATLLAAGNQKVID
ncbi:hypothetical protein AM500_13065 [Bacillus sp. FJAT-18017]|uniref:hypothetical protein n=1 Tax=Bacillus sp. FJAT-18017 TaxID=1705566 RepID=UPI0006AE963E|nr:hypothetical protein [Bacillus sp. FJAT-18017]ALC90613.1 hypothetical protein AM500_13065 [Bacillus sp. FJAT-18017]